ncbi:putative ATP-dependent RNA helicase DDX20 like protein [Argiope bruennichi]|uniref:RNA helicase n=1 Tax=Argiope bruennichi TaxID=94029 RepID=A0A8T0EG55_ARGBR|nr:putative ATP-dependent RNA helicase DDX20 like protein [Argiope bruennichi]
MAKRTAHILEEKWRSDDIRTGEDVDFSSLLLPDEILQGLLAAGFKYPSPIQLKAIPATRIGKDLIIQAKSGTGKTLVFAVAAFSMLLKEAKHPQVLILAPTREIACQISQVISSITAACKDIKCQYCIGGRKSADDMKRLERCQIVVGTPGRIKYLIMAKILRTSGIRLFVLDEADVLLREPSFLKDVDDIFRSLPRDKQIIATSATYASKLKRLVEKYFRQPIIIRLNKRKIGLLGMVHYYCVIPVSNLPVVAYKLKLEALSKILLNVKFGQCLVFCNMVSRVENLCVEIKNMGFATSFISSAREQEDRLKAIEMLRRFKCKVLVASDVSARGIDAENVDLVINFDIPNHLDIYFHRVGRAGRYGSKCANVSLITSNEIELYQQMLKDGNFKGYYLPVEEENSKLKVNGSNIGELCVNDELVGKKLDQQNCAASVIENTENGLSAHIHGLKQNADTNSYLVDLEKSLKEKIINDKLLVMNNGCSTSKNYSNPISKELISSVITFIEKYEDCSTSNSTKSSQSIDVELKDNKLSPVSLISLRSNLSQYYYNTYKEFIGNIPEVWIKEIAAEYRKVKNDIQVLEIGSQNDLKQIDDENKIPDSNLNLQHPLFSTPKTEALFESDEESNSGDENKLTEHFNLFLKNMHSKEEKHFSDTDADIMINSKLATCLLNEELIEQLSFDKEIADKSNEKTIINDAKSDSDLDASVEILYDSRQQGIKEEEIIIDDTKSGSNSDASVEFLYVSRKQGIKKEKIDIGDPFVEKSSIPESRSSSDSNSDTSVKGKDTMDMLDEAFNNDRVEGYNEEMVDENNEKAIINNADSSDQILYDAPPKRRRPQFEYQDNDGAFDKFVNKVLIYAKGKQNNADPSKDTENLFKFSTDMQSTGVGSSKDTKNLSKFPPEIHSTDKCIKRITKVDTKKHAESPGSREEIIKARIDDEKVMQIGKKELANIKKSSKPTSYWTKTILGPNQNKITKFYYSETESGVDEYSKESQSSLQDGHQRKAHKEGKLVTKTDGGCRAELINRPVEKKTLIYNSESSSSETDINCDQYSKVCDIYPQDRHNIKRNPKPFGFGYSNDTLNLYLNPACTRPSSEPRHSSPSHISNPYNRLCSQQSQNHRNQSACHSNYQRQLPCGVSGLCNDQCSRQSQNRMNQTVRHSRYQMQSATNGPNPTYQKYPQKILNHRNSTGVSTDHFNSPKNVCPSISRLQSIHEMEPSHNDFNPCVMPSQHPCHPPNESCQSLACAAWYDIFCKQWQLCNQSEYF